MDPCFVQAKDAESPWQTEFLVGGGLLAVEGVGQELKHGLEQVWTVAKKSSTPDLRLKVWKGSLFEESRNWVEDDKVFWEASWGRTVWKRPTDMWAQLAYDTWLPKARGRPLLAPLQAWLHARKTPIIHAACLSGKEGAKLLIGGPGAGKTTLTGMWFESGGSLLGEDLVALERRGQEFWVHSLYRSLFEGCPKEGKTLRFLPASRVVSSQRLCQIVCLDSTDSELARVPAAQVYKKLMTHAVLRAPTSLVADLLCDLSQQLPAWSLPRTKEPSQRLGQILTL